MKVSRGARLIILAVLLVAIDQLIKVLVKTNMQLGEQIYVIGQWFRLCFIENEGMAFGMKFGSCRQVFSEPVPHLPLRRTRMVDKFPE